MNQPVQDEDVLVKFRHLLGQLEKWRNEMQIALHHGADTHTVTDIVNMIMANRLHFYSWDDCFVVMELIEYPRFNVYHCFLAGGELEGVIRSIEPLKDVARALNCKYVSMAGRTGWQKVLRPRGWRFICTTMYNEVEDNNDGHGEGRHH